MTVIVILIAIAGPALRGFMGTGGRKGAVNQTLAGLEQARALAVLEGVPAYFVVADLASLRNADAGQINRYHYRSFALFKADAADVTGAPKIQVTPWNALAPNVAFRSDRFLRDGVYATTRVSFSPARANAPAGSDPQITCPYVRFNPTGEVENPTTTPTSGPLARHIGMMLFEGFVQIDQGQNVELATGKDADETIFLHRFTGRAVYQPR